ncbi:MAG: hypothetical protein K9N35_01610 [Candidatus Marinimicrobia bacterium]|nr:hypothetical protein [Candidatus Neomarinimicrobiota bacterium]
MTNKEKLDLLWKYLLLVVLVYGFAQIGRNHGPGLMMPKPVGMPGHEMMWMTDDDGLLDMSGMNNIEVVIEKTGDGDSTIVVTVNGKEVDAEDFDIKTIESGDGHIFIKKYKGDGKSGDGKLKIIHKQETIKDK